MVRGPAAVRSRRLPGTEVGTGATGSLGGIWPAKCSLLYFLFIICMPTFPGEILSFLISFVSSVNALDLVCILGGNYWWIMITLKVQFVIKDTVIVLTLE